MKLSIIVPIYNVAPYLRKCVDSLLAQDISDYEIILVDDGSTDDSGAIADEIVSEAIGNGQWAIDNETNRQSPIANHPNKATGLLFESGNADELAGKMIWALEHPEEVKQIIAQAQTDVQKYAWKNVKQQLMKVYE